MEKARGKLQAVRDALADVERVLERYERAKSRVEGTQARRFGGVAGDGNSVHHVGHDALENYIQTREELGEALNYWLELLKEQLGGQKEKSRALMAGLLTVVRVWSFQREGQK